MPSKPTAEKICCKPATSITATPFGVELLVSYPEDGGVMIRQPDDDLAVIYVEPMQVKALIRALRSAEVANRGTVASRKAGLWAAPALEQPTQIF